MTLTTATYDGAPAGMCLALPGHEISDAQAQYVQDALLNIPRETVRRGPVEAVTLTSSPTAAGIGLVQAMSPTGNQRVMVIQADGNVLIYDQFGTLLNTIAWPVSFGWSTAPFTLVHSNPALGGGSWIGVASQYEALSQQQLVYWRGGASPDYSSAGIAFTRAGGTAVTGTGFTQAMEGCHLINGDGMVVGVISQFNSATSLTLEMPALYNANGTPKITTFRGFVRRCGFGTVTTATNSTSVIGAGTKFSEQGIGSGWDLFRASDNKFIGSVASVQANFGLTLTGNAAIQTNNEYFWAIKQSEDSSVQNFPAPNVNRSTANSVGFITATWAGRQWYLNLSYAPGPWGEFSNRLVYSDLTHPESVDLSPMDGAFFDVTPSSGLSGPAKGMVATSNGLVVFLENETHIVTGTGPSNFTVQKIVDDGIVSGMSAVAYNGGAVWAGKNSIYNFTGSRVQPVTISSLGPAYKQLVKGDPKTYRVWGGIYRDHYFLHVENGSLPISVFKGFTSSTPSTLTISVYLVDGAVSTMSNMRLRGWAQTSPTNTWMLVNDATPLGKLCPVSSLFDKTGNDTVTCGGSTAGPDFYLWTKAYSMGDGLRLKSFRQFLLHYFVTGAGLQLDTVPGLNLTGVPTNATWQTANLTWDAFSALYDTWNQESAIYANWSAIEGAVWRTKRVTFMRRDQYIAVRLYQASSAVTDLRIGAWQFGYKLQRPGRL